MADLTNRLLFDIRPALQAIDRVGRQVDTLAKQIEDAFEDVDLDVDLREVTSDIGKIEANLEAALDASVDLDTSSATSAIDGIDADLKSLPDPSVDVDIALDDSALKPLRDVESGRFTAKVDVDTDVDGAISDISNSLSSFARGGAVTLGVAIGAALATGITDAIDIEAANDKLAAQLGLTEADAERLGAISGEVYAGGWGESVGEVNEAIKAIGFNLEDLSDLTDDELSSITEKTLDLTTAFDVDLDQSLRAAGQLVQSGLATDFEDAFDIITAGFQDGLNESDDFLDTLIEYSPNFRDIGLNAEDFLSLLSSGLDEGAFNTDKIADSFKEFGIRVRDETPGVAEAFDTLGLSQADFVTELDAGGERARQATLGILEAVQSIEDPILRNVTAIEIFGTQSEDLGPTIFAALDPVNDVFSDIEGSAQSMSDTLNDNVSVRIESFRRQALQRLSDFAANVLIPAVERIAPIVQSVFERVVEAITPFASLIGNIGPAVAGILPSIETYLDFVDRIVDAATGFAEALDFSPLLDALAEAWEAVSEAFEDVDWEEIFDNITKAIEIFFDVLEPVVQFLIDVFAPVLTNIGNVIAGIVRVVTGLLAGDWSRAWDGFKQAAINAVQAIFGPLARITSMVGNALSPVLDIVSSIWGSVESVTTDVLNSITGTIESVWGGISSIVGNALGAVTDIVSGAWSGIASTTTSAVNGIVSGVDSAWSSLSSATSTVFGSIGDVISAAWSSISETTTTIVNGFISANITAFETLSSAIGDILGGLQDIIAGIWNGISDTISSVVNGIESTITAVWNGISSTVTTVATAIQTTLGGIWDTISGAATTAWEGIESTITGGIQGALDFITGITADFLSLGTSLGQSFLDGLSAAFGAAGDIGSALINGIIDAINAGINFINDAIPNSIPLPGLPDIDLPDNPLPTIPNFFEGGIVKGTQAGTIGRIAEGGFDELLIGAGSSFARQLSLIRQFDGGRLFDRLGQVFTGAGGGGSSHVIEHHYHENITLVPPPTQSPKAWAEVAMGHLRRRQR